MGFPAVQEPARLGVGVTLAFIYIPLLVIAIYAFNGGPRSSGRSRASPPVVQRGDARRGGPQMRSGPRSRWERPRPRSL